MLNLCGVRIHYKNAIFQWDTTFPMEMKFHFFLCVCVWNCKWKPIQMQAETIQWNNKSGNVSCGATTTATTKIDAFHLNSISDSN